MPLVTAPKCVQDTTSASVSRTQSVKHMPFAQTFEGR
jgi:hypothetical protein